MKKPSHFFSFRPYGKDSGDDSDDEDRGDDGDFFHLEQALSWEDIEENRFRTVRPFSSLNLPSDAQMQNVERLHLRERQIIARREGGLEPESRKYTCYYEKCHFTARNFTEMKQHLVKEFEAMEKGKKLAESEATKAARYVDHKARLDRGRARQAEEQARKLEQYQVLPRSGSEEL